MRSEAALLILILGLAAFAAPLLFTGVYWRTREGWKYRYRRHQ